MEGSYRYTDRQINTFKRDKKILSYMVSYESKKVK